MTIKKIIKFLKHDIWKIRLRELPRNKSFLIRQLRVIVLAFRGFDEDKCELRASALTFFSLLSVVPAMALAFGIAQAFGLKKLLEEEIFERLQGQEEVMRWIINFANNMLENTRGGVIAGIGIASLLWFVIRLLNNIEKSFNDIWGVTRSRRLSRKLTDYIAIIFICPILLVTASSVTIFIKTQIIQITQGLGPINMIIPVSLKILPYCAIWLLFTFLYIIIPNTKVRFQSALVGGITAGTIFAIVQWVYITFQLGVSQYGAIYGSFAALPLFLVWLQISWLVVLLGSEISFAFQNVDRYKFEIDASLVKPRVKRLLCLRIAQLCVRNFCDGGRPYSAEKISNILGTSIKLVNHLLFDLVQCRILSETSEADSNETGFQPARDVNSLSINFITQALDDLGIQEIALPDSKELNKISASLKEFSSIIDNSDANILLRDI